VVIAFGIVSKILHDVSDRQDHLISHVLTNLEERNESETDRTKKRNGLRVVCGLVMARAKN
jgi:hypothetical protein